MTNEKARDFFSAYFEGSLDAGLCVSFEQKLKTDWSLKEEYAQFVRAMGELDSLKFEHISIPEDLHERIAARIDRHIYDRKQTAKAPFAQWLRGIAFVGVGAIAILGGLFALNRHSNTSEAGIVTLPSDKLDYTVTPEGVTLQILPASPETVVIRNQGKEISHETIDRNGLKTALSNPLPKASVFEIDLANQNPIYVVLPGRSRSAEGHGEGTMVDLARAASDFYHVPVRLEVKLTAERASWTFGTSDAVTEVAQAVGPSYAVTLLRSGMLEIEQK